MNQQTMFGDVGPYRLGSASAERDSILERVERKAETQDPGFTDRTQDFFLQYLRRNGPSSSEAMVDAAKKSGIRPADDRQFGPVIMKLSKSGVIVKDGHCQRRKGHSTSGGTIWKLATTN